MNLQQKWQRIQFMPSTPLGPDGRRLTAGPEHIALSREAAQKGMVLLKNEGNVLSLRLGQKIAVLGKAQADWVKGGGGSGDTTTPYHRTLLDGLHIKQQEGKLSLFEPLSAFYLGHVLSAYQAGGRPGKIEEAVPPLSLIEQAAAFTDTVLLPISRHSSEGSDRSPGKGDYLLSDEEEQLVSLAERYFTHVIVLLNVGSMMDGKWFAKNPRIEGALLCWQAGIEGGLAAADLLCGDAVPEGKLCDTFADSFDAWPYAERFFDSDQYVDYTEDIYVGYRYFETLPGKAERVLYPFGYGLSYTSFSIRNISVSEQGGQFTARASVRNEGAVTGRETLQVYVSAPQGRLGKPARVLTAFAKTKPLAPGQEERLTLSFAPYAFASFDDTGKVQKDAYVLEKGEYHFYVGTDVRQAALAEYTWILPENRVLCQLSPLAEPRHLKERLLADGTLEALPVTYPPFEADEALEDLPFDGQAPIECPFPIRYNSWKQPDVPTLRDVAAGKMTLEELMDTLSLPEKVFLLGGQPCRGIANTFGMGNLQKAGIPNVMTADGPAGLRAIPGHGVETTAFPCAILLSCTFDEELLTRVGRAAAREVKENNIGIWLAPAMNIHRHPMCGRNFEYYSEDPLLSGKMAAAMVRGVQAEGIAATIKHFACNNKEQNRRNCDSRVSARALREIYLKGFEICIQEADPWMLMTSYNPVNGVRASANRDLLTGILRGEWGFGGLVTTDWYTFGVQYKEIAAGNDIKMGCGTPWQTLRAVRDGDLDEETVNESVRRLLSMILKLD